MAAPAGKAKPSCKYGAKCYRKNAQHLQGFSHPGRDDEEEEEVTKKANQKPSKAKEAPKRTIVSYFTKTKKEHDVSDSESDDESQKTKRKKLEQTSPPKAETNEERKDEREGKSASSGDEEEEEVDLTPPASPADNSENISSKFLVSMPQDFFQFWDLCCSVDRSNPQGVFAKSLKLKLVGPFDILSGRYKKVTKNKWGRRPNYLLHYRYFYDPPELQTVLASKDGSNFHIGYFRDDPKEDPVFMASNNPDALSGKEKITPTGDNLFAAVHIHGTKLSKSSTVSSVEKKEIQKVLKLLEDAAGKHGLNLAASTPGMKQRQKKVVCPTFHGAGMVVPVDENEIGYRPVPETLADLRTMFKRIADGKDKAERDQNFEELQELITLVQFANDECDFGEGLELGLDLFSFGRKCFHPQIELLMPLAYQFLNRKVFADIINAHLKRRKNLDESVDELQV